MTEHMKWLQKIIEQSDSTDNTAQAYLYAVVKYILEYSELIRAQKIRILYLSGCLVGL
jgi:hypothetical protein